MNVDKICRAWELQISGIVLIVDLRVIDKSEFDVILVIDWLMSHRVVIDCDHRLLLTHQRMFVLCFMGISTTPYPKPCMTLNGTGS